MGIFGLDPAVWWCWIPRKRVQAGRIRESRRGGPADGRRPEVGSEPQLQLESWRPKCMDEGAGSCINHRAKDA